MKPVLITIGLFVFFMPFLRGQIDTLEHTEAGIDYKKRQKTLLLAGSGLYVAGSTTLYMAWYKQNEQQGFHFFNDSKEWLQMDKAGHIFSGYNQSLVVYKSFKWAGYKDSKSILYGTLAGFGFQSTIEIMDGFSSKWGFSNSDVISNIVGVSAFYFQQKYWNAQKIQFKMSYWPISHPTDNIQSQSGSISTSIDARAAVLFGTPVERFLKDYNGQTIWISFNLKSFFQQSKLPEWLAISIGYSGQNMYGGFNNQWEIDNENLFIDPFKFPRHRQYILALDYDLSRIRTKSQFINTLLDVGNMIKWPAPALEYNRVDGLKFHLIFRN